MQPSPATAQGSKAYLVLICLVATLGGLLFGYDTAVISGAIGFLQTHFDLDATWKGWAASSALVGCFIGVAFAGWLNDRLGRKVSLMAAAVLFLVSAVGTAVPQTLTQFIIFRMIGGLGVGVASMTSPMYIAEVSPARIRGRMVSLNQFAIIFGMLVVYFVNFFIGSHGTSLNHEAAARLMKQLPPDVVLNEPATRIVENRIAIQITSHRRMADQEAIARMAVVLDEVMEESGTDRGQALSVCSEGLDLELEEWNSNAVCTAVARKLGEYGLQPDGETVVPVARLLAAQVEDQVEVELLARRSMADLLGQELEAAKAEIPVAPDQIVAPLIGPVRTQGAEAWNVATGWRWMFGSEAIPALLLLGLMLLVPESPRFLTKQGRGNEAGRILARIDGKAHAEREMAEIETSLSEEGGSMRQLFQSPLLFVLIIGVSLAVLQQVTGINVFLYYAPEILKSVAGSDTDVALLQTVLVGAVNLLFTVLAIWIVDKVGRKPLMVIGATGMGICLAAIGVASWLQVIGPWLLVFMLGYIACFAVSVGPVTWVILSEIFPTKVRGRALAVATFALWVANYIVSQTFPMMDENPALVKAFNHGFPFLVYAVFCVVLLLVMIVLVPETKGRSLEEIERMWKKRG